MKKTTSEKSKAGKANRRKGHDFERELVVLLKEHGFDAVRVTSEGKFGNIGDVLIRDMNILIQAKAGKKPNFRTAIDQAEEAAGRRNQGWTPVGIIKEARGPGTPATRRAVLDLSYFVELLIQAKAGATPVVIEDDLPESDVHF